jgi:hypothetical protein
VEASQAQTTVVLLAQATMVSVLKDSAISVCQITVVMVLKVMVVLLLQQVSEIMEVVTVYHMDIVLIKFGYQEEYCSAL